MRLLALSKCASLLNPLLDQLLQNSY
uniref:Uncharacterized protein n=1 Tax=Arundo donax TaxID=35708 RepID=A0A0A9CE83_ARUDO